MFLIEKVVQFVRQSPILNSKPLYRLLERSLNFIESLFLKLRIKTNERREKTMIL